MPTEEEVKYETLKRQWKTRVVEVINTVPEIKLMDKIEVFHGLQLEMLLRISQGYLDSLFATKLKEQTLEKDTTVGCPPRDGPGGTRKG